MNTQAHFPFRDEPDPRQDPVATAKRLREQARKARDAAHPVIDAVAAARAAAKQAAQQVAQALEYRKRERADR